jgi:glutaryl-CoA dehydrogenase
MLEKISETGVNGLAAGPEYGGPGLSFHDMGAICYEMARRDASFSTGFYVHNLTIYTILLYGNEEQRQRLLPPYISFEKMASFGLTEPAYGSFATGLQTTATKVEGGYVLNGEKYWIGNGTLGDCMVWARNEADDGKIQAFIVDGRSDGFYAKTIQDKIALRSVQNAHIKLDNVFVPENNRLANVTNFEACTQVLTHSRLIVAWKASGIAAGAYEAALKYTLEREQFFRPIAQF